VQLQQHAPAHLGSQNAIVISTREFHIVQTDAGIFCRQLQQRIRQGGGHGQQVRQMMTGQSITAQRQSLLRSRIQYSDAMLSIQMQHGRIQKIQRVSPARAIGKVPGKRLCLPASTFSQGPLPLTLCWCT
jgi:hypothetical protein